jgi:hypothetical protein
MHPDRHPDERCSEEERPMSDHAAATGLTITIQADPAYAPSDRLRSAVDDLLSIAAEERDEVAGFELKNVQVTNFNWGTSPVGGVAINVASRLGPHEPLANEVIQGVFKF